MMYESHSPTPHFRTYANLNTAVVCATDDPKLERRCAVGLYFGGTGTAVLRPRGGSSEGTDDRTLTCSAGTLLAGETGIEFERIASGTATNVTVFWGR